MSRAAQIISDILKYTLWETPLPDYLLNEGEISVEEWQVVHSLARRQGVSAIAFEGMMRGKVAIPRAMKMRFISTTDSVEQEYERKKQALLKVARLGNEHGFKLMILKGLGLSLSYPTPQHRPSSDNDIWFFGRQREADRLIAEKFNISINEGHHHHTVFYVDGVMFENHYDFVEQHSRRSARIREQHLKSLSQSGTAIEQEIDGVKLYIPSPNHNALFLLLHSASHFASENISIRHLIDWVMFVKSYGDTTDWDLIYKIADECGFRQFIDCQNAMCIDYLGMPADMVRSAMEDRDVVARAIEDVMAYKAVDVPNGFIKGWIFRIKRRFAHQWKQKMVFRDNAVEAFILSALTHIIHPNVWRRD